MKSFSRNNGNNKLQANSVKERLHNSLLQKNVYRIGKLLGHGGNAEVYECIRVSDDEKFAIKGLRNPNRLMSARFKREMNVMVKCGARHKNILTIIEYSACAHWYIMPLATPSMKERARFNNEIDWVRYVISEIRDVANTLASLHADGIFHRDIKPGNILVVEGHFVISDFGLVRDYAVPSDLTISAKKLGPVFTMAPEMRRAPNISDYGLADVYSLAKTLWMFLMNDDRGFDGQYNYEDDYVYLHKDGRYKEISLSLIEQILHVCTDNEPRNRLTMEKFSKGLDNWLRTSAIPVLAQRSEWRLLMTAMFGGNVPKSAIYEAINDIVRVVNLVVRRPSFNHMLFPDGGGLDFVGVSRAQEKGCIAINSQNVISIIKPRRLYVESFAKGEYNYLLLEADDLEPIEDVDDSNNKCQFLVEDIPGHYVSARDYSYGVYDYETGKPFPPGWRPVRRYCSGKFLIVPKAGFYNSLIVSYDGCHDRLSSEEFRKRIDLACALEAIELAVQPDEKDSLCKSDDFWKRIFCFQKKEAPRIEFSDNKLAEDIESIDFKELITNVFKDPAAKLEFWIELFGVDNGLWLDIDSLFLEKRAILQHDGRFVKNANVDGNTFFVYDRDAAERLCVALMDKLHEKYDNDNAVLSGNIFARAGWNKVNPPDRMPTLEELKSAIESADDRRDNRLVMDENGVIMVVQAVGQHVAYPVESEIYCARNGYVGKYAKYSDQEYQQMYEEIISSYIQYIKTGQHQLMDGLIYPSTTDPVRELMELLGLAKD